MKILNCVMDNRFGGPHRRSCSVAQKLRNYNIDTVFLLGQKTKKTIPLDYFECFFIKHTQCIRRKRTVLSLLAFFLFLPYNLLKIRKIIKLNDIDIVHINGLLNIVPALAATLKGKQVIWHCNDSCLPRLVVKIFSFIVAILSDKVIIQGKKVGEYLFGNNLKLWSKAVIVYPSVDIEKFNAVRIDPYVRERIRSELKISSGCLLVGIIGNINPAKGLAYFVKAARGIKDKIDNVKFLIVGEKLDSAQSYWDELQDLVSSLALKDDVIFTGFRSDIAEILHALDVFVLSSIGEACPNVVLEAMAMKVPVVATNVGAVSELVINGCTGIVVPSQNSDAIANAVLELNQKPRTEIEQMVSNARTRVETRFSVDTIAEQQKKIYQALL